MLPFWMLRKLCLSPNLLASHVAISVVLNANAFDRVHRIKKDRRQKESQRKQKAAECRKHLTNIRFVFVNLCRWNYTFDYIFISLCWFGSPDAGFVEGAKVPTGCSAYLTTVRCYYKDKNIKSCIPLLNLFHNYCCLFGFNTEGEIGASVVFTTYIVENLLTVIIEVCTKTCFCNEYQKCCIMYYYYYKNLTRFCTSCTVKACFLSRIAFASFDQQVVRWSYKALSGVCWEDKGIHCIVALLCRVVQKNLVFVVGLSPRLCDAEILRRHEYFGKFGKIHKVVINQSTSYIGSQVSIPDL